MAAPRARKVSIRWLGTRATVLVPDQPEIRASPDFVLGVSRSEPGLVLARPSVDPERVALVHEQRDHDDEARLHRRVLAGALGRVASEAGLRLGDEEVDRDRELVRENATYAALAPIVEVLDTVDRAREHGDLVGPFASVAESLTAVTGKLGLTGFGEWRSMEDKFNRTVVRHWNNDAKHQ